MRKNNEILLVLVLAAVFASAFYSCSMREKDVQRLTPLAVAGNEKAMQNLMLYGDTIVPLDVREHYMQLLAENGNPEGLYAIVEPSRLRFQDMPFYDYTPENVKWLNHGAEKGDPYCLYMLSGYYDKKRAPRHGLVRQPYAAGRRQRICQGSSLYVPSKS